RLRKSHTLAAATQAARPHNARATYHAAFGLDNHRFRRPISGKTATIYRGKRSMTDASASAQSSPSNSGEVTPARMRLVVAASALGTVFEWYDFFVYAALASVLSPVFFAGLQDSQAFILTLLTFGVGFIVRPLGALAFGKIGDSTGRKGAFLITIT